MTEFSIIKSLWGGGGRFTIFCNLMTEISVVRLKKKSNGQEFGLLCVFFVNICQSVLILLSLLVLRVNVRFDLY